MIDTAFVLAGGLGTRLRPITNEVPKLLVQVQNKPIAEHGLEWLKANGIKKIIYAVGYKKEKMMDTADLIVGLKILFILKKSMLIFTQQVFKHFGISTQDFFTQHKSPWS